MVDRRRCREHCSTRYYFVQHCASCSDENGQNATHRFCGTCPTCVCEYPTTGQDLVHHSRVRVCPSSQSQSARCHWTIGGPRLEGRVHSSGLGIHVQHTV